MPRERRENRDSGESDVAAAAAAAASRRHWPPPFAAMVRHRLLLLSLLFVAFFSSLFFLSANGPQRARIHSLVTETQQQISQQIKHNFNNNEEDEKENLLAVDAKYLELLGLDGGDEGARRQPLWPHAPWAAAKNASAPVVLSAVRNGRAGEAVNFLRNAQLFLPSVTVVLYDLGLSSHEEQLVAKYCNTSLCLLKKFDASVYPSHVRNYKTNAFRYGGKSFNR